MGNQLNRPEKVLIRLQFEPEESVVAKAASMLRKEPELLAKTVNLSRDTLLHFAVYHRKARLVRLLVERGADRQARNAFGLRPADLLPQCAEEERGEDANCVQRVREALAGV